MVFAGKPILDGGIIGKKPARTCTVAATVPQNQAQLALFKKPYRTITHKAPAAIPSQESSAKTICTVIASSGRSPSILPSMLTW